MTVVHVSETPRQVRHRHPVVDRMVLAVLGSPLHGLLDPGIIGLRFAGRRTGVRVALPVMYAQCGARTVVLVGDAPAKTWWRNFRTPYPVDVRHAGTSQHGVGRVLDPDDPGYLDAARAYTQRHGLVPQPTDRVLVIDLPKNLPEDIRERTTDADG